MSARSHHVHPGMTSTFRTSGVARSCWCVGRGWDKMNVLDGIRGRPDLSIPPIRNCLRKLCVHKSDRFYVSRVDKPHNVLYYRSEPTAMSSNSDRESMETRADGVMKLAELPLAPISPLRTRFSYTLRWLIIHVAFCTGFEPTEVRE